MNQHHKTAAPKLKASDESISTYKSVHYKVYNILYNLETLKVVTTIIHYLHAAFRFSKKFYTFTLLLLKRFSDLWLTTSLWPAHQQHSS